MDERREIERWVGAVLAPEVRVAGTIASAEEVVPSRDYLARFPPALLVAFGRTPAGAVSPAPQLERVRAACAELGSPRPIAACDLEQGAGLHFDDATRLPPAVALAAAALEPGADEALDWIAAAGELTAREARARGVELVLAPVADVNTARDNPIIAARGFGDEPSAVAERATAFAIGLRAGGAGACAKHFPGHGDASADSHLELPRIGRDAAGLAAIELAPFRRLIQHGLDAVMVAHLDVPALAGRVGIPATHSAQVIESVLRGELGFGGAVLSDALNMEALAGHEPRHARALAAGCDGLLCPRDPAAAAAELLQAVASGVVSVERLRQSAERMLALRAALTDRSVPPGAVPDAARFAGRLAERSLRLSAVLRGRVGLVREALPAAETPEVARELGALRERLVVPGGELELVPVVCEARAGRGRYGLWAAELERLQGYLAGAGRPLVLLWFGSPQSVSLDVWRDPRWVVVLAGAPTPPMFAAVARLLERAAAGAALEREVLGSLPSRMG